MEQYISKSVVVAEIEKYISNYKGILNKVDKSSDDWVTSTLMLESKIDVLQHILSFLNTLEVKEEPVSENLEEAANKYIKGNYSPWLYKAMFDCFKAGAQWQKEQMMKDAIDGEVGYWNLRGLSVNVELPRSVEEGDKVKVIVIKED